MFPTTERNMAGTSPTGYDVASGVIGAVGGILIAREQKKGAASLMKHQERMLAMQQTTQMKQMELDAKKAEARIAEGGLLKLKKPTTWIAFAGVGLVIIGAIYVMKK